jgi:membrane fusion protein (multidrug efflux system)
MPAQPQADAPEHDNRKPRSARRRRPIVVIGLIVLAVGIVVGAVYYWHSRFYESTDDAYVQGDPVFVSARASGNIVRIHVTDNQWVPQGTLLVEIDPCDYQVRLAKMEATVRSARADEEQAAADVEVARAQWTLQQQDLRRNEELAKQGAVTTQVLEHSQAAAASAQASLNAAEKRLASLAAKTVEARVDVEQARLQLSYTRISAPAAGHVTGKKVEEGTYVNVGQPLLAIVLDAMHVVANFKETQLTHMRPGQPVTVTVDAYPGVVFDAHVDSIQAGTGAAFSLFPPENATGNFVKVVQRVPVKIVFNEPPDADHRLVLGMSVRPKVRIN